MENAAAAEAEGRSAEEEVLPVGVAVGGVDEEELAVEDLGEELVEIDEVDFAAEANHVGTVHPGNGVEEGIVVLFVGGVGLRGGTNLEARAAEGKFVNAAREVTRRAADAVVPY